MDRLLGVGAFGIFVCAMSASSGADAQPLPPGVGRIVFDDRVEHFAYVPERTSSGTPLRWPGSCVFLRPHVAGTTDIEGELEQTVIAQVLDHWQSSTRACGYLSLMLEPAEAGDVGLDYVNRILFREDRWCQPAAGGMPERCHDPDAGAITTLLYVDVPGSADDGVILDADIEINAAGYAVGVCEGGLCTTSGALPMVQDLANHLTHEIGHLVGLEHTCWSGAGPAPPDSEGGVVPLCSAPSLPFEVLIATMFAFFEPEETQKATLTSRDIEDFCEIYPLASDPGTCAPATPRDAGPADAGTDAGEADASAPDARVTDATAIDATIPDATAFDATVADATAIDATEPDASGPDAGTTPPPPPPADDASAPMDAARRGDAALRTVPIEDDGCAAASGEPRGAPITLVVLALCALVSARRRRRRTSRVPTFR